MKFLFPSSLLVAIAGTASAFLANIAGPGFTQQQKSLTGGAFFNHNHIAYRPHLYMSEKESDTAIVEAEFEKLSNEEKKQAVGNLVANDEWNGLSMELSEIIRMAVMEDIKSKTADFIGKENYSVGDISKEIDGRVKQEIANLRGKEDYELGDAIVVLDNMSKSMVEEMTGKEYETGDLSKTLDKKIKDAVAVWAGKEVGQYEFGDLSKAMDTRIKARVEEFTGAGEYKFGDISRELNERRKAWVTDLLGEDAAKNYKFGDITKKTLANLSGKEDYQFGDITKGLFKNVFGKDKK